MWYRFNDGNENFEDFDVEHFSDEETYEEKPQFKDGETTDANGKTIVTGGNGPEDFQQHEQIRRKTLKEKAIPKDQRATTPYMTKYGGQEF